MHVQLRFVQKYISRLRCKLVSGILNMCVDFSHAPLESTKKDKHGYQETHADNLRYESPGPSNRGLFSGLTQREDESATASQVKDRLKAVSLSGRDAGIVGVHTWRS